MRALVLHVEEGAGPLPPQEGNRGQSHVFLRSPVRVGQSRLNDLRLLAAEAPVQGMFHFGPEGVLYTDLQGGSLMAGRTLEPSEEALLAMGAEVCIGAARLRPELCELWPVEEARAWLGGSAESCGAALGTPEALPRSASEILERLLRSADAYEALLDRAGSVAEILCQSFLDLRRGQGRFAEEVGLPAVKQERGVDGVADGRELFGYLLGGDVKARGAELQSAMRELMVHELALLEGVAAGGRALLARFSPAAVKEAARGFWPVRARRRWKELERRYEELVTEERTLNDLLLGKEFASAYAAAAARYGGAGEAEHGMTPEDGGREERREPQKRAEEEEDQGTGSFAIVVEAS